MEYRLDELFDLQMGKTPDRKKTEYWNSEDHKWIAIGDLSRCGKYINKTKEYISEKAVIDTGIRQVPANTVIMSFKLSIGKTAITSEPMYSNEAIMSFRDKKVLEFLPDYIYYLLSSMDWEAGTNKAVMGKTLNKATLSATKIKVHPLVEQKVIVHVLDQVSSIIEVRKAELTTLDKLIKARFVEMFGDVIVNSKEWPLYSIGDVSISRLGKMLDAKQQTGKYTFPYLANFNVQWFNFDLSSLNQMDFDEADQEEFALKDGDLLVTEGGEVGRCAIWHEQISPCFYQKALHRIRCNKDVILPEYMAWWFKYHADYNKFEDVVGGVTSIAHLPGVKLKKMVIPVPTIQLQRRFADFVAQVDKSKLPLQNPAYGYSIFLAINRIYAVRQDIKASAAG